MVIFMPDRLREWYVPRSGPLHIRAVIGLTFYPYTLMVSSLVFFGSFFSHNIHIMRTIYLFITFAICLGISAHCFDSSLKKSPGPWANYIPRNILIIAGIVSLIGGLSFSFYFAFFVVHFLILAGLVEIFFVFAYNLELFGGFFHNNIFLAFSTGSMPIASGYIVQGGNNFLIILIMLATGYSLLQIQIQASRPYRSLIRGELIDASKLVKYYEKILKSVVIFSLLLALLVVITNTGL
ncbi:MAG: hypothetical protein RE471_08970 [Ferroplasma sp.]|uniref:hypothetical protein n=1 Tax=Ferroplasma sp. TaxID=2591003 RepID=UPI002815B787|nr:hypothetical protein [Ferroplasma sp.]WMT51095.1 MAG: hypothetical protein RE471_08970 [Ferroplasma sp.]